MLVERVVQLINQGLTDMDLLEVFLSRRIQPLQERAPPMWRYAGASDPIRVHPKDIDKETVVQWLRGITGARDNLWGSRRIPPFDDSHQPTEV